MEPLGEHESAKDRPFDKVDAAYKRLTLIPCSGCGYCIRCSQGVDIPGKLGAYNNHRVFLDKPEAARGRCAQCRDCDGRSPQDIPVGSWMPVVESVLGSSRPPVTRLSDAP